jgi:hypothetical protein
MPRKKKSPDTNTEIPLVWTDQPAKRQPALALCALAYIALGTVLIHAVFRHTGGLLPTVFGFLALAMSASRFFAPTKFTLDADGVRFEFLWMRHRMPWANVRSAEEGHDGVRLSPVSEAGLARNMRGMILPANANGEPSVARLVALVDRFATARTTARAAAPAAEEKVDA